MVIDFTFGQKKAPPALFFLRPPLGTKFRMGRAEAQVALMSAGRSVGAILLPNATAGAKLQRNSATLAIIFPQSTQYLHFFLFFLAYVKNKL